MSAYNILVVDDRFEDCSNIYGKLLNGCNDFNWRGISDPDEFEHTNFRALHAVILDINLNKGKWSHSLKESINMVGSSCPIILASAQWDTERTLREVTRVLADRGDVRIIQTIALETLQNEDSSEYVENVRQQIRLALSQYHRRAALDAAPDETLNILHISDPQFGDPDCEAFMPEAEIGEYIDGLVHDIHFATITGDISYSGNPKEFDDAVEGIDDLCKFVWGGSGVRERLLLVPGNHDVNLRLLAADYNKYDFKNHDFIPAVPKLEQHIKYGLQPFRDFAYEVTKDRRWNDSEELCWANESFLHLGLRFYHLNSAHGICRKDASAAAVPNRALKNILRAKPWADPKVFGIALSHHGPVDAADTDARSLDNWDEIRQTIKTSNICLFMHGHGHRRLAQKLDSWRETEDVVRVMAPTTHLNGKKRPPNERRGFNLIKLNRKDGVVFQVEVEPVRLDNGKAEPERDEPYTFDVLKD